MTLKTLIADDHPLVREGIKNVLQRIDTDQIILQAVDFNEARKTIKQQPDLDLIILDLCMPAMQGIHSIIELRHQLPSTPIVIISASNSIDDIRDVIDNGANGYIHKSSNNEIMLNALRLVLSGGLYLPPQWTEKSNPNTINDDKILTYRQKEVVNLLMTGKTNKEIAHQFSISEKTVKAHLSDIFRRLNANNRTQAVHQAKKLGLIRSSE